MFKIFKCNKLREFPKSDDNEQEHRDWIADATIEELDEYIRHFSAIPAFYRMALAQREKLHFHKLRKPHWIIYLTSLIVVLTFLLSVLVYWKEVSFFLHSLFQSVSHQSQ